MYMNGMLSRNLQGTYTSAQNCSALRCQTYVTSFTIQTESNHYS